LSVTDVGAHQIVFLNPMLTFISQTTHDFSLSLSLTASHVRYKSGWSI